MTFKSAKDIPLALLVEHLGGRYSHNGRKGETWWHSPFRPDERTASFVIHESTNTWHDFARTEKKDAHGGVIDLWADFHNQSRRDETSRKEAWRQIILLFSNGSIPPTKTGNTEHTRSQTSEENLSARYVLLRTPGKIWMDSLKTELMRRRLSLPIVSEFLKQAYVDDKKTRKKFNAFAFENDNGGWELSMYNPKTGYSFKNCFGSKGISSYNLKDAETIRVFESQWDFLTWQEMNKNKSASYGFIIAHGAGMSRSVAEALKSAKLTAQTVIIYQHNDEPKDSDQGMPPGERFTSEILEEMEETGLTIGTANDLYKGHKDLNEWWMTNPAIKMPW